MAIIRAPLKFIGGGKGRRTGPIGNSRQSKYGPRKGSKPAGTILSLRGNRRK